MLPYEMTHNFLVSWKLATSFAAAGMDSELSSSVKHALPVARERQSCIIHRSGDTTKTTAHLRRLVPLSPSGDTNGGASQTLICSAVATDAVIV